MSRFGFVLSAALLVVVGGVAGCSSLVGPRFGNPGPAGYQQSQALRFDPYPEIGPAPEIVGGRPLDYDKPLAEIFRSRWWLSDRWEGR